MGRTAGDPRHRKVAFFLLLAALALACIGLSVFIFEDAKTAAIDRLNERQLIHARQAASGIAGYFGYWTGVLSSLAKIEGVISVTGDGEAAMDFFREAHRGQIRSVTRVSERGVILYTSPHRASIGGDISGQAHVREILATRKPVVSEVFRTVQGDEGVAVHFPVFRGDDFRGTVAVVIDFQVLARQFLEVVRVGKTGYAWVISREGRILYSPIPGFTGRAVSEAYAGNAPIIAAAERMQLGREGVASYRFDQVGGRKTPRFTEHGVYLPIPLGSTFWSVMVTSSEKEVTSSLASFRNRLILAMGVILLGAVGLSTVGVKAWLIVREEGERRRVEEELRESEGRYRELFERNPAPTLVYEKETFRILSVNEAFLRHYGYSETEAAGLRLPDLYPEEEKGAIISLASRLEGHAYVGEWHHLKKDGTSMTIVARSHDITFAERKARIAVITDISDRKRAEDQLRELKETLEQKVRDRTAELEQASATLSGLDRLKSNFIASMSHELRTPLNSIIGFTGILLQGLAGPMNDEQRKQLGMVKGSARHLLDLITDIIDLSKIEAGKIDLCVEPFDLAGMVREVADGLRVQAGQKGIALSVEAPGALPVEGDPRRVRQVLINLAGNAVKFTERGGVEVRTAEEDGNAVVSVRDTGPGIRPGDMEKLFRQFRQVGTGGSGKNDGTGLGLYLSRKLMNLMGGDIRVESEFGRGSIFIATIPRSRRKETR